VVTGGATVGVGDAVVKATVVPPVTYAVHLTSVQHPCCPVELMTQILPASQYLLLEQQVAVEGAHPPNEQHLYPASQYFPSAQHVAPVGTHSHKVLHVLPAGQVPSTPQQTSVLAVLQ
jgi:hypothetical protein